MEGRFFLFLLLFACAVLGLQAQHFDKAHLSIEGQVFSGKILSHNEEVKGFLLDGGNSIYNLKLGYKTLPSDSSLFASDYNYPVFGMGFSVTDFSRVRMTEQSRLGNIYTLYGFMDRTLFRLHRFQLDYMVDAGLAYATCPYDPLKNPMNGFVGSPLMVYVGFGLGVKYRLTSQFEVGLDAAAKHYSSGRLGMPNNGINLIGAELSARYYFDPVPEKYPRMSAVAFPRKWYFHFSTGMGWQTSLQEWQIYAIGQPDPALKKSEFKRYPKYSVSADAMYRLCRKYGLGVGVDLFYTPHTGKLREWDDILSAGLEMSAVTYNPLSVGVALSQEIYYKNLALSASFGYYAFRKLGIEEKERFYQRAGFRYYFPALNNLFLGYSIKAHNFSQAEYLELSIGMRFK